MGNAIHPVLVSKSQPSIPQYSIIPVFQFFRGGSAALYY